MRVILSRKGFDGTAGGCPSPVVDGRPLSLPIPTSRPTPTTYGDLASPLPRLVVDLTRGRLGPGDGCHLDPDLDPDALHGGRRPGLRGNLGQEGAAQGHLANQGVGPGDLFLFFGLFQAVRRGEDGRWRFHGARQHAIFGWLQVAEMLALGKDGRWAARERPWLAMHPHVREGWGANNALYLARDALDLGDSPRGVCGWGRFTRPIALTEPGAERVTDWCLPSWLDPTQGGTGLTYHPPARWRGKGRLRAASRGQEFVARCGQRTDALDWLRSLWAGSLVGGADETSAGQSQLRAKL